MKLFINDRFIGRVISYEQDRERGGWRFILEDHAELFISFSNIRFLNTPDLDIITK